MSTIDDQSIDIALECDPELNYLPWKVSFENFAASKATIIAPTGLLTDILSDTQWSNLPLNRATSPGGTLTIALRPVPPTHSPITMGMTNATISVAKLQTKDHVFHDQRPTYQPHRRGNWRIPIA